MIDRHPAQMYVEASSSFCSAEARQRQAEERGNAGKAKSRETRPSVWRGDEPCLANTHLSPDIGTSQLGRQAKPLRRCANLGLRNLYCRAFSPFCFCGKDPRCNFPAQRHACPAAAERERRRQGAWPKQGGRARSRDVRSRAKPGLGAETRPCASAQHRSLASSNPRCRPCESGGSR
jgi:hypothetical protein